MSQGDRVWWDGKKGTNLEGGWAGQIPRFKEHVEVPQNQLEVQKVGEAEYEILI